MTDKMLALVREIEIGGEFLGARGKIKVGLEPTRKSSDLNLLNLINNVARDLPSNVQHEYFILIDDLDLHWKGAPLQNSFLGAMFLSIRKLSRDRKVKFVVSLRKNIYRDIVFEERDKFTPLICEVSWDKDSVKKMIGKRLSYVLKISTSEVWGKLFPSNGFDKLWESTDHMPREAIRLAAACVKTAVRNDHSSIKDSDILAATREFSEERRDELGSEFMHSYPELGVVLQVFSGGRGEFDSEYLREKSFKVSEIALRTPTRSDSFAWATAGFDVMIPYRLRESC